MWKRPVEFKVRTYLRLLNVDNCDNECTLSCRKLFIFVHKMLELGDEVDFFAPDNCPFSFFSTPLLAAKAVGQCDN